VKNLLGVLIAIIGREDISKSTVGNESLCEMNNNDGIKVVNFATSEKS
jgi:hypothetical protein